MSYKIQFDPERCVACGACTVACMDQNDILMQEGVDLHEDHFIRKTYTTEVEMDGAVQIGYFSTACQHCDNAPCIAVCPADCLFKDPGTGFVVYDTTDCIGCRRCYMACPHEAVLFGKDGKMVKCDGCSERVKAGLLPACVAVCPFDALVLEKTV